MSGDILFLVVAAAGFIAVAALGLAFAGAGGGGGAASKRVAAVAATGRAERIARAGKPQADAAGVRRKQILLNLKELDRQERRAKLTIEARIAQAGLSYSVKTFWIGSAVLGVVLGVTAAVTFKLPLAGLGVAIGGGLGLPRWILSFMCQRRHKKFTAEFPNAVDIIVRGIKSGLPLHDCIRVIAAESPEPLATEFRKLVESLGMGMSVDQALEKMYGRMSTSEVRFFTIVLAIQQKAGGNLAEALANLSAVLRARALMREKIKAMSGEAVASAMIIGALPPGVMGLITVTQPAYMAPIWTDPRGHMALMVGAAMMGLGIFVMRKMINFKF